MTPDEENAFYAEPDNQTPRAPPVLRKAKLSEPVPVRFPRILRGSRASSQGGQNLGVDIVPVSLP